MTPMTFGYRTTFFIGIVLVISVALMVLFGILLWYVFRALRKYL